MAASILLILLYGMGRWHPSFLAKEGINLRRERKRERWPHPFLIFFLKGMSNPSRYLGHDLYELFTVAFGEPLSISSGWVSSQHSVDGEMYLAVSPARRRVAAARAAARAVANTAAAGAVEDRHPGARIAGRFSTLPRAPPRASAGGAHGAYVRLRELRQAGEAVRG